MAIPPAVRSVLVAVALAGAIVQVATVAAVAPVAVAPAGAATGWSVTFTTTFQGTFGPRGAFSGEASGTVELTRRPASVGSDLIAAAQGDQLIDYEAFDIAPPSGCTRTGIADGVQGVVSLVEPKDRGQRYDVLLGLHSDSHSPPPGMDNFGQELYSCATGPHREDLGGTLWDCVSTAPTPASEGNRGGLYFSLHPGETRTFTGSTSGEYCSGVSGTSSTTVTLTTPTLTAPSVPRNVAVTISDTTHGPTLSASWQAPSSPGSAPLREYRIRVTVDGARLRDDLVSLSSPTAGFLLPFTSYGKPVTVQVLARNEVGQLSPPGGPGPLVPVPFSDVTAFVDRTFRDVVGRAATASERSTWAGPLRQGTKTPGQLLTALRTGSDATTNVDPVVRLYRAYYLRDPEVGGFDYWLAQRRSGRSLAWVSDSFARAPEFAQKYGTLTHEGFVRRVYQNVLGRPGEESGVQYWTSQIATGRKTRGGVMLGFSESAEYRQVLAPRVHALVLFLTLLDGTPASAPVNDWERMIATTPATGVAEVAHRIIGLPEYRQRVRTS